MAHRPPAELVEFLKPYDCAIQKLALDLRKIVIDELAPCHESIYDAYSAVAIGYGSSDRFSDGLCHIAVYAKNVNLGFNEGASLDDPDGVLLGTGKRIRHLTLKSQADLKRPEIRAFLRSALALARDDARKLGEPISMGQKSGKQVISTVKAIYKKKRRPF